MGAVVSLLGIVILGGFGYGYRVRRAAGRTGPNSRALMYERVVAIRTDIQTNRAVRVGRLSLFRRLAARLRTVTKPR